jgi:serine/threonine protein kinase
MSDLSEPKRCPKCGSPIPGDAPQGLCPKCVLLQASLPTNAAKGRPAPSREEVAAAFPQLEILELIGQGGMGFVFKARQPKLERLVALKILPQAPAADPAFAERFTREARVLARLNHPNIVAIHDFGQAGNFFYLLMEFVDGVNLRQAMRAGRFTPAQALAVVPKICEALQFAHDEGVLHRDIKPENILVDTKGRVKIADFGIAKLLGDAQPGGTLTGSGAMLGTPHYMAPEQLEKPGTVDHRADIYSLGVVFYEMLTGELPLGRFQPPSQKVEMDVRLDEVVLHALEKEPSRRYQQASQVKTAVETIAGGTPQPAPVAPAPKPDHHLTRNELVGALAVSAFALCLTCFGMFLRIEKKSALAEVLAGFALLLLIDVWNEILKKTAVQTIANGTAQPSPVAPAPKPDRFWRRMAVAMAGLCLVLIALVFVFARSSFLANQRANAPSPSEETLLLRSLLAAQQKAAANYSPKSPVPAAKAEKEAAQLVIDTEKTVPLKVLPSRTGRSGTDMEPRVLDALQWKFKYLIPANHLAQVLFVLWSNGVPSVNPRYSGYFKVGPKPVNVVGMDINYKRLSLETNVAEWDVNPGFGYTGGGRVTNQAPLRKLETAPRSFLHSGHQLAIRLAECDLPPGSASNGWSGVELRLILQALTSPAVQTDPNELVTDMYVCGWGLAEASENSILKLMKELPMEPQPVEKSP